MNTHRVMTSHALRRLSRARVPYAARGEAGDGVAMSTGRGATRDDHREVPRTRGRAPLRSRRAHTR
ncbi:hypothetical protein, partial [Streptomyces sp. SID4985]|uniref:hypothetical protein n=1 Tax=Streptomyces sp. SID4985 TaxID=2690292 RepID=UPI001F40901F